MIVRGLGRGVAVLASALLAAITLSACSAPPSADELDGAERARPDGGRALASIEVPPLHGWSVLAERRIDACGSLTSDRDWDDAHLESYSCATVRRIVYEPADATNSVELDEIAYAAIATIEESLESTVDDQESAWFSVSDNVPSALARFQVDGLDTRIGMQVSTVDAADIDIRPLWHRNNTIHEDDGKLVDKITTSSDPDDPVFVVTITVTYFEELRDDD